MLDSQFKDGVFFFVMEFCNNGSIDTQMKYFAPDPLPLNGAMDIMFQVLDGLDYAHANKIVHRDLKPSNILLSSDGEKKTAKISNFGLAKAFDLAGLSACTGTGAVGGSVKFIPRQQIVNFKHVGPEVDVWSAAAVCYYMLTGFAPREFPADVDFLKVILETDPVPLRKRNPELPEKLADVLDSALQDSGELLFWSAYELKNALQEVL
jgi:serine/threonine protein kinase